MTLMSCRHARPDDITERLRTNDLKLANKHTQATFYEWKERKKKKREGEGGGVLAANPLFSIFADCKGKQKDFERGVLMETKTKQSIQKKKKKTALNRLLKRGKRKTTTN